MIHQITDTSILDDMVLYAQYTTRELDDARIRRVHTRCLLRGKTELARRIALKYGKIIDEPFKDDRVMAVAYTLMILKNKKV